MKKLFLTAVFAALCVVGCGKVSKAPIAPLVNPTTVFLNFDTGLNGWMPLQATYKGATYDLSATPNAAGLDGHDKVAFSTEHTFNDSPGALRMDVAMGAVADKFDSGVTFNGVDPGFKGRVISAWVYWDSGLTNSSGKVVAKLYGLDNTWAWEGGDDATLVQGRWVQMTWSPKGTIDITKLNVLGVEFYGSTGPLSPGVAYLDYITY